MKKENVKVLIGSKKEAKDAARVLRVMGETPNRKYFKVEPEGMWFFLDETDGDWVLGYKDFAHARSRKEITLKQLVQLLAGEEEKRTPMLTSEDGVPLYEGGEFWSVSNDDWEDQIGTKNWEIKNSIGPHKLSFSSAVMKRRDRNKAFSSKEAAETWIAEQNKQRYISIQSDMYKLKIWSIDGTLFIESKDFSQRFMTSDLQEWIETCNKTAP